MSKEDFYIGQKLLLVNKTEHSMCQECEVEQVGRDFIWLDNGFRIDSKRQFMVQKKENNSWKDDTFLYPYDAKKYNKRLKMLDTLYSSINRYNNYVRKHGTCKKLGEQQFVKPSKDRLIFSSDEYIQSLIKYIDKEFNELVERRRIYKELKTKQDEQQSDESSVD